MAVYNQIAFRFRNDNGTEVTATWIADQNVNIFNITLDANVRIRLEVEETAGLDSLSLSCQLQYSLNGGTWTSINGSSNVARSTASPNVADSAATTDQMTASAKSYEPGSFDEANGLAGTAAGMQNEVTDLEWCVQIRDADVADGDTIDFRGTSGGAGATPFASYTVIGRMTVGAAPASSNTPRLNAKWTHFWGGR